jgi:hypothetical protein
MSHAPMPPADTTGSRRILFVPVSGSGGAGEYYRALALARAMAGAYPQTQIMFVLDRHARYAAEAPFPVHLLDDSPTRDARSVVRCIERFKPHLIVFDNAGRVSQLRAARRIGAHTVYLSSRWKTRWKGFRLRRMRWLDQHWIIGPDFTNPPLNRWERLKLKLYPRMRVRRFAVLSEPASCAKILERFDVQPDGFVLVCPGGAGRFGDAPDSSGIFLAAAQRIAQHGSHKVLFVGAAANVTAQEGVQVIPSVRNADLMLLARAARVCVLNGGSLVLQAMAEAAAAVAAPIAGDQQERITRLAQRGAVIPAELDSESLVQNTIMLLRDDAARSALRSRATALGIRNAVEEATAALAALLWPESRATEARKADE